jgi:hypothetical protein
MDDLLDALTRLDTRLQDLERRVGALDHLSSSSPQSAPAESAPSASRSSAALPARISDPSEANVGIAIPIAATGAAEFALPQAGGIFPVIGKAMLGIAGAYVLRAVAESGSFPKMAVVALALAYAGTWLVWSARVRVGAQFASAAYAATAALILAPMLAELTLRFQILPSLATAGLLAVFVIAAYVLSWKRNLAAVIWAAETVAALTALALLVLSHDLAPYTAALLVMAAAAEFAGARDRWVGLRLLIAPAADIAVLILIYIHSLPDAARPGYVSVSNSTLLLLPTLLFLIYGAGIAGRTVLLRRRMALYELLQAVIAFGLGAMSWLWFGSAAGRLGLGICCWVLAAACYAGAFFWFDRLEEQRNYHVYSTWSLGLVLVGSFLLLSPSWIAIFLSAAAIVATLAGVRVARLTPEFHGLVYLAAAAFASGLLQYASRALAGTFPSAPGWMVWLVAIAALVCYTIGGRFAGERWNERLLRLLAAVLAVSAVATFLVSCLVWLAATGMTPGASHVAAIRTLITCTLALALAFGGSRWQRTELIWTAYGVLAFVSAKLLFEDLPHGRSGLIAVSIFFYAVSLILIPRVARGRVR